MKGLTLPAPMRGIVILCLFAFPLPPNASASDIGTGAPIVPMTIGELYVVDSVGDENNPDDGVTTLREAIAMTNANPGMDTIVFSNALTGKRIQVSAGYLINDNIQINAAEAPGLVIESSDTNLGHLFNLSGSTSFWLSDIYLFASKGSATRMIYACGNIELNRIKVENFNTIFNPCSDVSISMHSSSLLDNEYVIWNDPYYGTGTPTDITLSFERSLIHNTETLLRYPLGEAQIDIVESVVSGNSPIRMNGETITLNIDRSSFIDNKESSAVSSYFGPKINITNSTFSGFRRNILSLSESSTRIAHSTFYGNTLPADSRHSPFLISVSRGEIQISHSLINAEGPSAYGIDAAATEITVDFSIIPEINTSSSIVELDQTSQQYLGANFTLAERSTDPSIPPYHVAVAGSFIIDSGEAGAIAGLGDIPDKEQRGSARVIGAGIDIGAVEFNFAPEIDLKALQDELSEQFSALKEAENPGGDIVIDLDNFVTDPDGHLVADIRLTGNDLIAFDTESRVLSGTYENFRANKDLLVEMEDETGLTSRRSFSAFGGSSSSTGSLSVLFMIIASGLIWRQRS